VFQFLHCATECWLRDTQTARGLGKTEFFSDGLKVAEMKKFHWVIAARHNADSETPILLQAA
jgi:hypothetical protein